MTVVIILKKLINNPEIIFFQSHVQDSVDLLAGELDPNLLKDAGTIKRQMLE